MNASARAFPVQPRRGILLTAGFFALALFAGYKLANYILKDDFVGLALSALVFAGSAIVFVILNNWRNGLHVFIVWLLFEDLARKFLGNNMAIYFAKDVILAVVYLSFFLSRRRGEEPAERFRPPFRVALLVLVWFGFVQMFNPESTHLAYGILGMKLYFAYVPLLFVGYHLIRSEVELRRFFYLNLGLMMVITVLGVAQAIIGPRFLNPAVLQEDIRLLSETYRVSPISGVSVYRPTSVFVSTGRFGDLLIISWILVFGFSGYLLLRHKSGRIFAFSALALTAAGCLMCASRGALTWSLGSAVVGGVAFIWGAPWRQGEALRIARFIQRSLLGIALAVVVLLVTYPEAFLGRIAVYSETLDPRSPASELVHRARDYPLSNFLSAFSYPRWPYGYGIGVTSLGVQYVGRFFHVRPPIGTVESGFGTIVLEMGIGGLILWVIMSAAVLFHTWKVVYGLKGSPWFPLAFMIFLYAFLLFLPMTFTSMTNYQDFVLNSYVWLLLGIVFRLPKLAQDSTTPNAVDLVTSR